MYQDLAIITVVYAKTEVENPNILKNNEKEVILTDG
jgi:hypothetical protein